MVKKISPTQEKSAPAAAPVHPLAASVRESAQQIWLAGMGAFAKAQEEGGKVFDALVKEGLSLQKKTQGLAEEKLGDVAGRMSAMAETVGAKAGQNWDKLESLFEQRTAKAMARLGVPTAKDVAALSQRVDALAAELARVGKPARTAAETAVKRAVKRAAKPATPKAAPAAPRSRRSRSATAA